MFGGGTSEASRKVGGIIKVAHHSLRRDLVEKRSKRGSRVKVDVEKDTKRMQLRMKHLRRKEEEMKAELGELDQKLFELELNSMEHGYVSGDDSGDDMGDEDIDTDQEGEGDWGEDEEEDDDNEEKEGEEEKEEGEF